ncbi:Holliday junction resolvase RuvX [Croceitalea sp. MTPC5]|uniref:Holliday junction resolvase RuvX n=1 Tax=Croceitalea sp. MTPC5 TaxID=3056565 RepID=UPI0030D37D43
MARILALDFGKVRTGVAVTDELQLIASGLKTVQTSNLIAFLKDYITTENVECIVIGEPRQMDGTPSESEALIEPFLKKLKQLFPQLVLERQDERFTSKMAVQSMISGGLNKKKRQNKALVDEISATLILQSFLNKKH